MLAKRVNELPADGDWVFEPKWDGFRALVFRDGDEIFIQSRDEKPLNRYFPELLEPLRAALPARCVLDGEMVIVKNEGLDFDALQLRLHPAASRVKLLSGKIPASFVFFDLLCLGDRDLCGEAFQKRRRELESLLASASAPIHLTPATSDRSIAADWFRRFEGAGLDGVMAKDPAGTYEPNKRVMLKVKHERDCDCVVAGFRWHKKGEHTTCGQGCAQWFQQLRKVTIERFFVAALDENFISIAKHQGSKTVPLRLENPIPLCGQFIHPLREHRQDRRIYGKVHTPWYNVVCSMHGRMCSALKNITMPSYSSTCALVTGRYFTNL